MPGGDYGLNFDGIDLRKYLPSGQAGAFMNGPPTPTLNPDGTLTIPYDRPGATDRAVVGDVKPQLTGPGLQPEVLGVPPGSGFKWPLTPENSPETTVGNPQAQQAASAAKAKEDSFVARWKKLANDKNFMGALALMGQGLQNGKSPDAGPVPKPQIPPFGATQHLNPGKDLSGAASQAMSKAAGYTTGLTGPGALLRQGPVGGEADRYDILRRRTQQDALKGLLG